MKEKFLYKNILFSKSFISNKWKGACCKILACVLFAAINVIVRHITGMSYDNYLPSAEIVFIQNLFGLTFMLPWLFKHRSTFSIKHLNMHIIRVTSAILGLIFWYATLSYMPVAEALAISFTSPIFTIIGVRVFLKEKLTLVKIVAIVVSFIGAFFVLRPDQCFYINNNFANYIIILPIISTISWVGAKISGRHLAYNGEPAKVMTSFLLLFMAPVSLIPALFVWISPTLNQWLWLLLLGILSTCAHLAIARSLALSEVSFLSPFGFLRLFFGFIFAYIIFNEIPNSFSTWLGIFMIIFSIFILKYGKFIKIVIFNKIKYAST